MKNEYAILEERGNNAIVDLDYLRWVCDELSKRVQLNSGIIHVLEESVAKITKELRDEIIDIRYEDDTCRVAIEWLNDNDVII
tara:strand:- start:677 stop:925 length:249 start_codon:yes stop_codon:yes gene_type:complete